MLKASSNFERASLCLHLHMRDQKQLSLATLLQSLSSIFSPFFSWSVISSLPQFSAASFQTLRVRRVHAASFLRNAKLPLHEFTKLQHLIEAIICNFAIFEANLRFAPLYGLLKRLKVIYCPGHLLASQRKDDERRRFTILSSRGFSEFEEAAGE